MCVDGFEHAMSKHSLTAPINIEFDEFPKSPCYDPSLPSPTDNVSDSEMSDDPGTSSGSHVSCPSPWLGGSHVVAPNASPAEESSSASSSHANQVSPLPTFSVTAPPAPSPLYIPKRGPLATIIRSDSLPDSPGSPVTGAVDLTRQVKTLSTQAFAHGGFSDIHWGELEHRSEDGQIKTTRVVIKLLRVLSRHDIDGGRARKRLNREVYVWHRLQHPNIARMFGTSYHMGGRPAMVLEWYQNGSASEFLKKNTFADRKMLVLDVARGLNYLHHTLRPHIVHGDLKANNVLITSDQRAVLTDFGLSKVIEDLIGPSGNTTSTIQGSVRWQAPELVLDDDDHQTPRLTLSSDVWSFACTAYELLTGKLPYHNRLRDFSVISDILHGVKPGEPDNSLVHTPGPQDKIWNLLNHCWSVSADARPRMMEVEAELAKHDP